MSALENRYARSEPTPGLVAWIYEYRNRDVIPPCDEMATGVEIGVQLRGDWLIDRLRRDKHLYRPGQIYRLDSAQRYRQTFTAPHEPGLQVGFILYRDVLPAVDGELRFAPTRPQASDARFVELCQAFNSADALGQPLPGDQVLAEVKRYFLANAQLVPRDPMLDAKHVIDRTYDRPLYLAQLAEMAAMQRTSFTRAFASRFGITPIRYRLMLRLNEAARLSWARPDLGIAEIAHQVGFEDLPYFHRAFLRQFGTTPASYGRRR